MGNRLFLPSLTSPSTHWVKSTIAWHLLSKVCHPHAHYHHYYAEMEKLLLFLSFMILKELFEIRCGWSNRIVTWLDSIAKVGANLSTKKPPICSNFPCFGNRIKVLGFTKWIKGCWFVWLVGTSSCARSMSSKIDYFAMTILKTEAQRAQRLWWGFIMWRVWHLARDWMWMSLSLPLILQETSHPSFTKKFD